MTNKTAKLALAGLLGGIAAKAEHVPAWRVTTDRLEVGDGIQLNGVAFRITDISPRGLVLKPMSGKLEHSVQHGWQVVSGG